MTINRKSPTPSIRRETPAGERSGVHTRTIPPRSRDTPGDFLNLARIWPPGGATASIPACTGWDSVEQLPSLLRPSAGGVDICRMPSTGRPAGSISIASAPIPPHVPQPSSVYQSPSLSHGSGALGAGIRVHSAVARRVCPIPARPPGPRSPCVSAIAQLMGKYVDSPYLILFS